MRDTKMTVLAIGSTAVGLVLMVASVGRNIPVLNALSAQEQREVVLQREFPVTPGGQLVVDVWDADVLVETGGGQTATVMVEVGARDLAWGREVFDRMQFTASNDGNTVNVKAVNPRIEGHEWRQHKGVHVTTRITIPARFDVRLTTGDGDVSLGDVTGQVEISTGDGDVSLGNVDGRVEVRTGDGDLDLGRLTGLDVTIRSGDGDINIAAITAEHIDIGTTDGDVQLRSVSGPLDASTSDGDIDVYLQQAAPVSIRTGDGDVTISMAGDLGVTLDLRGEDIDLPRGLLVEQMRSNRSVRGSINGGGPDVRVATGDGSVSVNLANR